MPAIDRPLSDRRHGRKGDGGFSAGLFEMESVANRGRASALYVHACTPGSGGQLDQ